MLWENKKKIKEELFVVCLFFSCVKRWKVQKNMRSLLMLVVALPQIFCDNPSTNDNEKYTQTHIPTHMQSSLYCNDLNPQMHLDFNMVNFHSCDHLIDIWLYCSFFVHIHRIFLIKFFRCPVVLIEFFVCAFDAIRKVF